MDSILNDYVYIFESFFCISVFVICVYFAFRYFVGELCKDKLFLQKCTRLVIWKGLCDIYFLFFGGLFIATYGLDVYASVILLLACVVLLLNIYLLSLSLLLLLLIPIAQYTYFGLLKKGSTEILIARLNKTCHSGYKKAHLSLVPSPNGKNVFYATVLFISICALFSIALLFPFWCFVQK